MDRTCISYLESDLKLPTVEMLATLCGALEMAPSELIPQTEKSH